MALALDAALVLIAFLLGAIPFGLVVSRAFYGTDIRASGSGNIGAANALRTLGKAGAVAVLALDGGKGAVAVAAGAAGGAALAASGGADAATMALVCAFAAVAGHCFSPFLRFRGGKGVATQFGALLAIAWPAGAAFALVWIAVVIACGYSSLGSMLACVAMIPALWFLLGTPGAVYGAATAVLIVFMHRANIARLRDGTEGTLPLFRSQKGQT